MTQTTRPASDIIEEIHGIISHYPPLQADRHKIQIDVSDGVVVLSGHVKSLVSRRYLIDHVAQVTGVNAVDAERLFTEETIRLEAGQRIPSGVIANASYGTVVLTGALPASASAESVVTDVALIPGVERVVTKF